MGRMVKIGGEKGEEKVKVKIKGFPKSDLVKIAEEIKQSIRS